MQKKAICLFIILFYLSTNIFAQKPEWIYKLPFTVDAFWGIGEGYTKEEAIIYAKQDILMQLCSQVKAAITMENYSNGGDTEVLESLDTYINNSSLRGAEVEEEYEESGRYWVLMKYCDECGKMLMNSSLSRYEVVYDYDSVKVMKKLEDGNIAKELITERREVEKEQQRIRIEVQSLEAQLKELALTDYNVQNINVVLKGKSLIILVINFIPYETNLSESQKQELEKVSETLFLELTRMNYNRIEVIGHANPTGGENEFTELNELSKNRAETMVSFLRDAGLKIEVIDWRGGTEIIGDITTQEGRGRNRRVEIIVSFE